MEKHTRTYVNVHTYAYVRITTQVRNIVAPIIEHGSPSGSDLNECVRTYVIHRQIVPTLFYCDNVLRANVGSRVTMDDSQGHKYERIHITTWVDNEEAWLPLFIRPRRVSFT